MPNNIPDAFLPWVAQPGDSMAAIKEPVFCDHHAADVLMPYLPAELNQRTYSMKQVAADDNSHIRLEVGGTVWSEPLKVVLESLQLTPSQDNGVECLVADRETLNGSNFSGWSVIDWKVVKNRDSNGERIHQDLLTFKDNGSDATASAILSWLPYASMQE